MSEESWIICLFFILLTTSADGAERCRDSWTRNNLSCYLTSHSLASWAEASFMCRAFNAYLIEIETWAEDYYIRNHLLRDKTGIFWIGASDIEKEGNFRWTRSQQDLSYKGWFPGQPDNSVQDCVDMYAQDNFGWHDDNCEDRNSFICEITLEPPPTYVG